MKNIYQLNNIQKRRVLIFGYYFGYRGHNSQLMIPRFRRFRSILGALEFGIENFYEKYCRFQICNFLKVAY